MSGGSRSDGRARPTLFNPTEPPDLRLDATDDAPFDADEFYALSVLHHDGQTRTQASARRRKVRALDDLRRARAGTAHSGARAQDAGRVAGDVSRPGPHFLDNRVTTVKRVFRRILPVLIPADPTESLAPEERFAELLEILQASKKNRLWLAFLTNPMPGPEESTGSSLDLAARPAGEEMSGATVAPDILHDELRVLLGFWLEMPVARLS